MTDQELKEWHEFYIQYKNGYHLSSYDWINFVRLNHRVMEVCHEIHNKNMAELN